MRVLVIGSGGREHALCWAIAASPALEKLFCAPGNPGIADHAECVAVAALDIAGLIAFALAERIDLIVPGPEGPLVAGIADAAAAASIACCGPTAAAARLEGSKAFCKELADTANIPTARWDAFTSAAQARAFVHRRGAPIVVKADGLAGGKGVVVARSVAEAEEAITAMMERHSLGAAGGTILLEECLTGGEISVFALCDGTDAIFLGAAQDHKRVGDGDTGPNTGGMGAFSPVPGFTPSLAEAAMASIIRPALAALAGRGTPFRGILFAGLMLTADGLKLIEFNVRFGDPECQALLPLLQGDLLLALWAACNGELTTVDLGWSADHAVAVVLAAPGYPADPARLLPISNLAAARSERVQVFHAGTTLRAGVLVSDGGRVLTVCATGRDGAEARHRAYNAIDAIGLPGGFCRRDIALAAGPVAGGVADKASFSSPVGIS